MSCLLILFSYLYISPGASPNIEGDWIGGWQVGGDWISVKAQFNHEKEPIGGSIDLQQLGGLTRKLTLTKTDLKGSRLRLEASQDAATHALAIVLDGQLKGDEIVGTFQQGEAQGQFKLLRISQVDPKLFDQYIGSYRLASDNFISIGRQTRTGQNPRLGYIERKSGRRGNLTPISETTFIGGPALGLDYPADVEITFVRNKLGVVEGLKWRHGTAADRFATNLGLKEEEVRFRNGEITLAGTLTLPLTGGPHPAIVLAHGSTPLHRHYFGPDPYMYPVYGVAVLFYDKRGVGASTGTRTERIEELATDILAGVEYLKTRREIDPKQIGLFGHSEGGWVVPEAASRSKDVAFIIAGAASGLPRQENLLHEMDGDLRHAGFSETDRGRARALWKLRNDVIGANGEGWNKWREEVIKAKNEKWFPLARTPGSVSEMNETNRARLMNFIADERSWWYDPVPAWVKITVPALVYESEWDKEVPGPESAAIIGQSLRKAGNKDYTIKVFPKSQHGQWAIESDSPNNPLSYKVHYDQIFDWLRAHVMLRQ